jgi:hypothetical protein
MHHAGQLGDVLEESARIALSWVRAHAAALGLPGDATCPSRKWDVHIHLPAGVWVCICVCVRVCMCVAPVLADCLASQLAASE